MRLCPPPASGEPFITLCTAQSLLMSSLSRFNRDNELINSDWAVHKVMKGSPLAGGGQSLMGKGGLEPVVKRHGNSVMGYYPMKLGSACVACHAQNGLKQAEGGFGGAF